MKNKIEKAKGKLGVLIPGIGNTATSLIAGVEAMKLGLGKPIGSLSQSGNINLYSEPDITSQNIMDIVSLAKIKDLVFGGWDISNDNVLQTAKRRKILDPSLMHVIGDQLKKIIPMEEIMDMDYFSRSDISARYKPKCKFDVAKQIMYEIENFSVVNNCSRLVMIICDYRKEYFIDSTAFNSIDQFEDGLSNNDPAITSSMIYAYAAIKLGIPFINGSSSAICEIPALQELADRTNTPLAGKEFKSAQLFLQNIIGQGLQSNMMGASKFKTNISHSRYLDYDLYNNNVENSGIDHAPMYATLNGNGCGEHKSSGFPCYDDKTESFEMIDFYGWLGHPMKLQVNFSFKESIIMAPLALDLILYMDLANRAGLKGIQTWLSFYFNSPAANGNNKINKNIFRQLSDLENKIEEMNRDEFINRINLKDIA